MSADDTHNEIPCFPMLLCHCAHRCSLLLHAVHASCLCSGHRACFHAGLQGGQRNQAAGIQPTRLDGEGPSMYCCIFQWATRTPSILYAANMQTVETASQLHSVPGYTLPPGSCSAASFPQGHLGRPVAWVSSSVAILRLALLCGCNRKSATARQKGSATLTMDTPSHTQVYTPPWHHSPHCNGLPVFVQPSAVPNNFRSCSFASTRFLEGHACCRRAFKVHDSALATCWLQGCKGTGTTMTVWS